MTQKMLRGAAAFVLCAGVILVMAGWRYTSAAYPEYTLVLRKSVVSATYGTEVSLERIAQRSDGTEAHEILPVYKYPGTAGTYIRDWKNTFLPQLGSSFRRLWNSDCSDAFGGHESFAPAKSVFGFRTVAFEFDSRNPGETAHTKSTIVAAPDLGCILVGESSEEYDSSGNVVRRIQADALALSNQADSDRTAVR